jgi:hypothetical protein
LTSNLAPGIIALDIDLAVWYTLRPVDEFEFGIKFKKLDIINSAIQMAIKVGGLVGIFAIIGSTLRVMTGRETVLNIAIQIVATMKLSSKISYALGLAGVAYGLRQRRLRRSVIERMSEHQRKLEQSLDQGRTSSEITLKGTTRPDDRSLE